jgi:uncharacterized protein (DUF983 family)
MTIHIDEKTAVTPPLRVAPRSLWSAMLRGTQLTCPNCGHGQMFERYLKVTDQCGTCSEELHHHRADDAPPYFTIFIAGHLIVAGVLAVEQAFHPEPWIQAVVWLPLTLALCLMLLPRIKGALVGLQWALRMHGFGDPADDAHALTGDGPGQIVPPAVAASSVGRTPTNLG